jgi:parallel beta-helix repeat protein
VGYINSVTPTETGVGGGAVVRLTGTNLFWWETDVWFVPLNPSAGSAGRKSCAVVREYSEPNGSLLSCRAPRGAPGAYRLVLNNSTADNANVNIQLSSALTPAISILTTQPHAPALSGAAGDTLLIGVKDAGLIRDGEHQLEARFVPVASALGRETVHSMRPDAHTSVARLDPNTPGQWFWHVPIPKAVAGMYTLEIAVDRLTLRDSRVHGNALFPGGATRAAVQILPTVNMITPAVAGESEGASVTIHGSGFNPRVGEASVRIGGRECKVHSADVHWIACTLQAAGRGEERGMESPVHAPVPDRGFRFQRANAAEFQHCIGHPDAFAKCTTHNLTASGRTEHIPHELKWPSDHARGEGFTTEQFFGRGDAALLPPVTGLYTFEIVCPHELCEMQLTDGKDVLTGTQREPTVGPVHLSHGQQYPFRVSFAHRNVGEQFQVKVSVQAANGQSMALEAVPASWFVSTISGDATKASNVHVQIGDVLASHRCTSESDCNIQLRKSYTPLIAECILRDAAGGIVMLDASTPSSIAIGSSLACSGKHHITAKAEDFSVEHVALNMGATQICIAQVSGDGASFSCIVTKLPCSPMVSELSVHTAVGAAVFTNLVLLVSDHVCQEDAPAVSRRLSEAEAATSQVPWGTCTTACELARGVEFVMNDDIEVETLTIKGAFRWNTSRAGLTLKAAYVVVEAGGSFECGTEQQPMLLPATIYIRNMTSVADHHILGNRFFGGIDNSSISVHGVKLPRTWTLLSHVSKAGSNLLRLKHDPVTIGWKVGDLLGIATSRPASEAINGKHSGSTKHRITQIGVVPDWSLSVSATWVTRPPTPITSSPTPSPTPDTANCAVTCVGMAMETSWHEQGTPVCGNNGCGSGAPYVGTQSYGCSGSPNSWGGKCCDVRTCPQAATSPTPAPAPVNRIPSGGVLWMNMTGPANISSIDLLWDSIVGFNVTVQAQSGSQGAWSTVLSNVPAAATLNIEVVNGSTLSIKVQHESSFPASVSLVAINGKETGVELAQLTAVFIDPPLSSAALGGYVNIRGRDFEMATEVMNLERNVLITGEHADFHQTQQGIHTVQAHGGVMKLSYARIEYCGQRDVMGKYCMHLHLVGKCPECVFRGNAVDESHQHGITIHGTHDSLVDNNVLFNARGQGIYIEDGNEMNNTVSSNVITCATHKTCQIQKESGLYMIGMTNHILYNRISHYQNTVFTPGGWRGHGLATHRTCPAHTPFGRWKGNVGHAGGRFGIYLNNQYSRNVTRDADGYITDFASCDITTKDGTDNGLLSVIEDQFEWHQGFIGQYSLGDIQYLRYTSVNNGNPMYWKKVNHVNL